nr:Toll/interleukin-1 receptor (TIR) domain-containing protein [Tanacetum cinerariifolium]
MPTWITGRTKGPSISFTIPSSPNKLRGLNLCYVLTLIRPYWRSRLENGNSEYPFHQLHNLPLIKIHNITKNLTWIYRHYVDRVNVGGKSLTFLSHWMFGENEMEDGDQLTISISNYNTTAAVNTYTLGRPVPSRPWEQQQTYGGAGYGSGLGMYRGGGYGGGLYGSGGGMYGGGMYNSSYGGMGGMGMGPGGPYGDDDPNNPFGPPSQPPGFWISLMRLEGTGLPSVFVFTAAVVLFVRTISPGLAVPEFSTTSLVLPADAGLKGQDQMTTQLVPMV